MVVVLHFVALFALPLGKYGTEILRRGEQYATKQEGGGGDHEKSGSAEAQRVREKGNWSVAVVLLAFCVAYLADFSSPVRRLPLRLSSLSSLLCG